jgi:UDP-N-acetylmuramate dehydrogenase
LTVTLEQTLDRALVDRLQAELTESEVRLNEPMSGHTSFRIGGPADVLVMPRSVADLIRTVRLARAHGAKLTITGNGSNLLVRDGGIRGVVVKLGEHFQRIDVETPRMRVQAGALLGDVSRAAAAAGLTGLEFAVGIPGTLGGAIMMNAGAYGGEMKDVVTRVTVLDPNDGETALLGPDELQFGYRKSALQGTGRIVAEVEMDLRPGDAAAILERMAELTRQREEKQPLAFPSAGSVFKRPPGRYVGPMVEELGLKGYRIGGAQVSEKHAGFIVNCGDATARDVLALIQHVRAEVQRAFNVTLETEVQVIGEE